MKLNIICELRMNVTSLLKIINMTTPCSFEAFSVTDVNQDIHVFWAVMPVATISHLQVPQTLKMGTVPL